MIIRRETYEQGTGKLLMVKDVEIPDVPKARNFEAEIDALKNEVAILKEKLGI